MSDAILGTLDRRRMLFSLAVAFLLHALVVIALLLGVGSRVAPAQEPPVIIDVQISSAPVAAPASVPSSVAVPSYAPATLPAASANGGDGGNAGGTAGSGGSGGFVIPTPRGSVDPGAPIIPSASGFREAGGRTGATGNLPSVPEQSNAPAVPPVQSGKAAGAGSGTGSVQRSGTGVAVTGGSGTGSGGTLDYSQLDKAISGSGTGGTGKGRAGAGQGTQAGTGSGTGAGTTKGGTGTGGSGIVWDQPETSKGRVLISDVTPKVPSWVGRQGLTLFVTVAFTVTPNGVVATARIEKSSGYADVDAAVIDAIRRSVFSPSKGTATVTGTRPYVIRAG